MKNTENTELYTSPAMECIIQINEGVLCQSGDGTHEGVDFENWN